MRFLIEPLAITLPVGAFNGSSIVDAAMNPVEQHLIPASAVARSLEVLGEFGVDIWLFTNDQWLTKNGDGEYVPNEKRAIKADPTMIDDFTPYLSRRARWSAHRRLREAGALRDGDAEGARRAGDRGALAGLLSRHHPARRDKGTFVQTMARRLGISTDAVATIGDMHNDVAMFEVSGLSFAMGNATDEVKKHAKRVTARTRRMALREAMQIVLGRTRGGVSITCGSCDPLERAAGEGRQITSTSAPPASRSLPCAPRRGYARC